jgi:hypothetical protein
VQDIVYLGDAVALSFKVVERDGRPLDLTRYDVVKVAVGRPLDGGLYSQEFALDPALASAEGECEAVIPAGSLHDPGWWGAQVVGLIGGVPQQHSDPFEFEVRNVVGNG